MKIIVGLGNPGEKYKKTRHNAGFLVIDKLAEELNLNWRQQKKFQALTAQNADILLIKPQTFMNNSGISLAKALNYYHLLPKKLALITKKGQDLSSFLTIIHDDSDIILGKYKITNDSRSAGHKGVQSIIQYLKTQKIQRYRIGIKTKTLDNRPLNQTVLENFSNPEIKIIDQVADEIIKQLAI